MEIGILSELRNKNGNALPLACIIVICLLLISSVIMEYIRITIIASGVRDALQTSVISVSTQNYDKVYNGLREGYSGGYNKMGGGVWQERLNYGDIYAELNQLLGLNGVHTKTTGGDIEYRLSDLSVNIINSPFAPTNTNSSNKFTADAKINLHVPLTFGWGILPPIKITIKTTAGYIPKF